MMRDILDPILIQLKEIPEEGQSFTYDQNHPAMTGAIGDLVKDNPFSIQLFIQPGGGIFIVHGSIKTNMDLACYRCAIDFKYGINESINEILVFEGERPRGSQSARVNHLSELGVNAPSMTTIKAGPFNLGDFVHEIIALAEPFQPKAKADCDENCENLQEAYSKGWLERPDRSGSAGTSVANPFTVLKDFKLNS